MRWISLVLLVVLVPGCGSAPPKATDFKTVVLGFDGVDPDLVRDWIDQLPNLRELSESGTLRDLGTTNPPESPVSWATFATGTNPGKHGIFDFLTRDPKTYFPDIGLVHREKPKFILNSIPVRRPVVVNNRKGTPFWKAIDEAGFASVNLRMPLEFPPTPLDHGRTLSGLGLPDIRGTWGTYFYFATDLSQWDAANTEFGGRLIRLEKTDGKMAAQLDGPVDPRRDDFSRLAIPVEFELNQAEDALAIRLQGQAETVAEGQWSDWFVIEFSVGPFVSLRGISRFYVLETFPEVRVYLMPISLDPTDPPLAISSPSGYAETLARREGLYKTLGWIHETWGLNEQRIDEGLFLQDLFRNMDNLERMLLSELEKGDASLYTTVFTATDSVSHMFYRLIDPQHPMYDAELARQYGSAILDVYKRMDTIIGEVRKRLSDRDVLLVVSDHGFHTWRREFNTNTWLVRNGFMQLKGSDSDGDLRKLDLMFSGGSFFPNVDWSRTKAYALGLGQIYINLKGRERDGVVEPGDEYRKVVGEIQAAIVDYRDPDNGDPVVANAYARDDIYKGGEVDHAGDLLISFHTGYRTSWQTALGAVPENILVANLKKWSGDHCASDISETSGFLASNRRVADERPSIVDVAPTVYRLFGLEIPEQVDGKAWTLQAP